MAGPVEELVQARIKDLWEKTDFSATLFGSLVGYAVIAADFDGNILAYNEGARQIYGYDPEEVLGRQNIEIFFPRTFLEAGYLQQIVDVLLATGRFGYEGEKVRKGGDHFPAQVLFTLTKDRAGKVVGFVEIVQDLTERKRAEEELRNHRDHLGVLVAERTAELARANEDLQAEVSERKRVEAELRQRAQELAEAGRRKDEFLAMLAHELRNPLAPVLNGLHILSLAGGDRQTAEQARAMMERQVRHLARLVDDLLDVSRITRGKVRVRRERLDLAGLVRTAAEDRRPMLEQAGMRLCPEVPDKPVWVAGDATRLAQVLNNLLDNAVKFKGHGDRVAVRLAVDAERGQAVLAVRDHGIGIEPAMLPRLFDVFAQADRSLDRSGGGLGLGLAVVKGLVELHGGEVRAASGGPGQGAEFVIRLPLKEERPALSHPPQAVRPPMREPLRILIVEDNRDAADSLGLLLGLDGHDVAVAYAGPEGVQKARAWRPDVVLCDIGLPGLDGYGVASALRRDPSTARAHLIAVTGYGQEEDRRRSRQAGFDHHLTKPVDPNDLRQLLARPFSTS